MTGRAASLDHRANVTANPGAGLLADALDKATGTVHDENKSPSRKVNDMDTRGSHFYLAMYWAQALAEQDVDAALKSRFASFAAALKANESTIIDELNAVQGVAMDLGGYYKLDATKAIAAMRPSTTFNEILARV